MAARKDSKTSSSRLDLENSVAGEEDPGASIDLAMPGGSDQAQGQPSASAAPMSPGDEAPPGTPGTGENVCPACGGTGRLGGRICPQCDGTGRVTEGIGGG